MSLNDWKKYTISDVLERVSIPVKPLPGVEYREIGIRSHGKGIFHKEITCAETIGNKRVFETIPNALVLNIVFAWEQAVAKVTEKEKGFLASHRFPQFLPKNELCDVEYLLYLFKTPRGKYLLNLASPGGAGRNKTLGQKEFERLEVQLPPIEEQRKIVKIISTWDKAIDVAERLIENSKQQKKALMQQLLTGKKRFQNSQIAFSKRKGFSIAKLGEFPDDWKVELLSNLFWFQEGPGVRKHQFTESGVKLFNGTNIQNSRINLSKTKTFISEEEANGAYSHFLADAGDLVIACSGISVEKFDEKIAFLKKEHLPLCMNTSTMRFKVKEKAEACLTYLQYFMMSSTFKDQIRRQITGSAQLNFGPSHVGKCFIALPPLEEQKHISRVLTKADAELDLLMKRLDDLKQEKKALMQQLLTGKRRVKVDASEAA